MLLAHACSLTFGQLRRGPHRDASPGAEPPEPPRPRWPACTDPARPSPPPSNWGMALRHIWSWRRRLRPSGRGA